MWIKKRNTSDGLKLLWQQILQDDLQFCYVFKNVFRCKYWWWINYLLQQPNVFFVDGDFSNCVWVVEVMMRFRNMQKHSFDSSIYIIYLNDTLTFARVFSPLAVCMCIYSSICTEWNCIINMNVQNREYVKNYTLLGRRRFFCLWLSLRQEQKDFEALETDLVCQLRAETGTTEMTMMIW